MCDVDVECIVLLDIRQISLKWHGLEMHCWLRNRTCWFNSWIWRRASMHCRMSCQVPRLWSSCMRQRSVNSRVTLIHCLTSAHRSVCGLASLTIGLQLFSCVSYLLRSWLSFIRYGDSIDNTVEENSSIFSLIRMRWLPSVRACGHENFAPTKSSSS